MGLYDTPKDAHLRLFQKYVTLINRVMAETPKLKKTRFCFLIIKGSIYNIFKNGKKLDTLQLQLLMYYCKKYKTNKVKYFIFLPDPEERKKDMIRISNTGKK